MRLLPPRPWAFFLGLLALAWGGLRIAPVLAAEPAPACGALGAVPDAVQVAWISPSGKTVGGGAWMEVVRVADLRTFLRAQGANQVRLLQALGMANTKGKGRAAKRDYKVTIFDVRSAWMCRPLDAGDAEKVVEGVAVCPAGQQQGATRRGFSGCGYTKDALTGGRGLEVYRVRWRDASSGGFCVMPLDRFLQGA